MNESCHIWMSHVSHINESCLIWMSQSHMNESCHIWMSHVSHMNGSCLICVSYVSYEWVISHMKESCPILTFISHTSVIFCCVLCINRAPVLHMGHASIICELTPSSVTWIIHMRSDLFIWDMTCLYENDDASSLSIARCIMTHSSYEWVMSHMNESCLVSMSHVDEWVMLHLRCILRPSIARSWEWERRRIFAIVCLYENEDASCNCLRRCSRQLCVISPASSYVSATHCNTLQHTATRWPTIARCIFILV